MALHPVNDFRLVFRGTALGREMGFEVTETKESRNITYSNDIIYNVIVNPHNDTLMSSYLWNDAERDQQNYLTDEFIIAWNVWYFAGDALLNGYLAKKWPPECTKTGANQYEVRIHYAPLFLVNFNISPIKTKRLSGFVQPEVWEFPPGGGSTDLVTGGVQSVHEKEAHAFINIDKDGKVQGTDVIEPTFSWTERWAWGPEDDLIVSDDNNEQTSYLKELAKLTATVNTTPFRGFEAGEILFRGASGRCVSPLLWEIDYNFAMRPNRTTIEHGSEIIGVDPEWQSGWNHVDITSQTVATTIRYDRKIIFPVPLFIRLHKIYKSDDFGKLRIHEELNLAWGQRIGGTWGIDELPRIGITSTGRPKPGSIRATYTSN